MKKIPSCLWSILFIFLLFENGCVYADEQINDAENPLMFMSECDTEKDFSVMKNVTLYQIPKEEQDAFYGDFTTLQRKAEGEAYVVVPIPYMRTVTAEAYYWGGEAIEDLVFEFSKTGEEWTVLPFEKEIIQEENKWRCVLYTVSDIASGTGLMKIEFPNNPTVWSPLVGKIVAQLEESFAKGIETQEQNIFAVPRFDTKEYHLCAQVLDQMDLPMEHSIEWEMKNELPGITLSSDGILTVTNQGYGEESLRNISVIVSCADAGLMTEWEIFFHNALLGDYNDDFIINDSELAYALLNYCVTADSIENWNEIRLIDIDDNGVIDVYDIAYLAKHQSQQEEIDGKEIYKGWKDSE